MNSALHYVGPVVQKMITGSL